MEVFARIVRVQVPEVLEADSEGRNPPFEVQFIADGDIPFPQVVVHANGQAHCVNGAAIRRTKAPEPTYVANVPGGLTHTSEIHLQIEGCQRLDLQRATGDEWIKAFAVVRVVAKADLVSSASSNSNSNANPSSSLSSSGKNTPPATQLGGVKLYFGIHKHMHQPYYNTTDRSYWDGEKDGIFGARGGNYTDYIPAAVRQYVQGGLPHAGLSTSWSGSLIEQLDRCGAEGLCGGRFLRWSAPLSEIANEKTALGHPRVDFSAFGFFHPLMPLIPTRDIVKQIQWHRGLIRRTFGVEASRILFPPETAFHVRIIPALIEAGIDAVIYDSIHRFRTCEAYPYAGTGEGLLPPNRAEQVNPPVNDWLQLRNIWAGSKISPSLLRPEYVEYVDVDGQRSKIIAVPAERYIGNEDARGGFGALLYPEVLGQVYDRVVESGTFDPQHPPFFLLHSDGDNHGGGADSYYKHNTGRLVEWLRQDPRFELTTVPDYLTRFPPDASKAVHIEPGSWSGADNGDPQFMKWFSRYNEPYSPDLNSWAVLTAFQNVVHALEDRTPELPSLGEAVRLLLTAETSCYWYWTGQNVWDEQVTRAANRGLELVRAGLDALTGSGTDRTAPTIFPPWVTPENPGGQRWGRGSLEPAPREGVAHTFVSDVSGIKTVELVLRTGGREKVVAMHDHGPYPCETGAALTAHYFTAALPVGAGDVRYFVRAVDQRGNATKSALERVFLA
ncbi:MAG: glycosyl hydrolase family 57 [Deltaproteobacteria bacterium]|nr:glycosyl hydrolase family 57 [Deltaproteobacteria bacterium]